MRAATYDEVLEERFAVFEVDVGAAGEVGDLLEEDGVGPVDFTHVYCHFLRRLSWLILKQNRCHPYEFLGREYGVHDRDI